MKEDIITKLRDEVIACSRRGQLDRARVCCTKILDKEENNVFAHANLANILFLQGKYKEAIDEFNRAKQLVPDDVIIRGNLALFYISQGNLNEAQKEIGELLKINSSYPTAYNLLGNIYFYKREFSQTKLNYKKAIKLDPKFADAWNNLGSVFVEENDLESAEGCYKKALEIDPGNPSWNSNLGKVLLGQNKPELALEYYRNAIRINPKLDDIRKILVSICTALGVKSYKKGDLKGADRYFEEVLKFDPGDIKTYNRIAGIQLALQNYTEAYKWYKLCIDNCAGIDLDKYPYLRRLSKTGGNV